MKWFVLVLMLIGGCYAAAPSQPAGPTPYQPMGMTGGYDEVRTGDDTYFVVVKGNVYSDVPTVRLYLRRRAAELCGEHFAIEDEDVGRKDVESRASTFGAAHGTAYGAATTAKETFKPNVSATVRCGVSREGVIEGR